METKYITCVLPGRISDIFIFKITNCLYLDELLLSRFCYKASVDHIFVLYNYILCRYPREFFRQVLIYSRFFSSWLEYSKLYVMKHKHL